jgi:hypothetical protein
MFTTNNQQHSIGGTMDTEKIKEILLERANKLTEEEKQWTKKHLRIWADNYLLNYMEDPTTEFSDRDWQNIWCWSSFGQYYFFNNSLAKKFLSSEKKMNHVMDMMESRKTWYSTGVEEIKNLLADGKLSQNIMVLIICKMRKENRNIFESYVNDPFFETGAIVQFRSNIGVDAILEEQKWSNRTSYYGATSKTMKNLKDKTLMVLGESPALNGRNYAAAYSWNEKQGGARYYRVLPVGETTVYNVVEKFLKKCRTKAVKDAKK